MKFFSFLSNLIQSLVLEKSVEKVRLKFWIQRSVRILIVVRVSMLSACERGLPSVDLMDWKGTAYLLSTSLLVHGRKKRDLTMVLITIKQYILKILKVRHVCELVLQLKCTQITALFTNMRTQKPPSQLRFSLPSIIITITSNEPWNIETHKTDRNPPITNHKLWPFEPVKVKFCFLRGPLKWLTAAKNAIVSWLLNFRIRMFVKSAVSNLAFEFVFGMRAAGVMVAKSRVTFLTNTSYTI